jgi:hypothetical protein
VDGVVITGEPIRLGAVGGINPNNERVQGELMSAQLPSGGRLYWLQGTDTNYILGTDTKAILHDGSGDIIPYLGQPGGDPKRRAEGRARELIAHGAASRLRSLDSKYVTDPPVGNYTQLVSYANAADVALLKKLQDQNVVQQIIFRGITAHEQAKNQIQTVLADAAAGRVTIAQARTQIDNILQSNGAELDLHDIPVITVKPPKDGATRTTELADPRNRSVGHTLNGKTLITHLLAEQHYDAKLKTWVTDRIVAQGVIEYSKTPITPAQKKKVPDHPQFGFFAGRSHRREVVTDQQGVPITDPDKARARVLELFKYGGLTIGTY